MIRCENFILVFFLIMSSFLKAQTFVPAGSVSGNWLLWGSPYKVQGNISVLNGTTLNIEPGVTIEFQGKYRLFCNGRILAIGTSAQPITFTVPTANIANGWLGIRFDDTPSTNQTSYFKYCNVKYGKANLSLENVGGGFYFNNFSNCTIENCLITNNFAQDGGSAIYCFNASPLIKNCTFSGNSTYQGGNCVQFVASSSIIEGNTFVGGGIESTNSPLIIRNNHISGANESGVWSYMTDLSLPSIEITNNLIENNVAQGGSGGGGISLFNGNAIIEHNIIRNNSSACCGGGITCWNFSFNDNLQDTVISNNLIYGNSSGSSSGGLTTGGGAILCSNNSAKIINNTICNNSSSSNGGAIKCISNSDPELYNNIIYDNKVNNIVQNIFLYENNCDPSLFNNCLQGGLLGIDYNEYEFTGSYLNNIDLLPNFTNQAGYDYSLNQLSPCINSGITNGITLLIPPTDIAANPRVSGIGIDMGAYEFQELMDVGSFVSQNKIYCYPNPASDIINLSEAAENIDIIDVNGRNIDARIYEGSKINISHLQSGIYFLILKKDGNNCQIRFIKK
jgi:hypothetical protein